MFAGSVVIDGAGAVPASCSERSPRLAPPRPDQRAQARLSGTKPVARSTASSCRRLDEFWGIGEDLATPVRSSAGRCLHLFEHQGAQFVAGRGLSRWVSAKGYRRPMSFLV